MPYVSISSYTATRTNIAKHAPFYMLANVLCWNMRETFEFAKRSKQLSVLGVCPPMITDLFHHREETVKEIVDLRAAKIRKSAGNDCHTDLSECRRTSFQPLLNVFRNFESYSIRDLVTKMVTVHGVERKSFELGIDAEGLLRPGLRLCCPNHDLPIR